MGGYRLELWSFVCFVCIAASPRGLLCILHWSSCVYKEFRSIWLAFEAVLGIPRASSTIIAENRIDSLSMPRLLFVLATLALRAVIAGILLVAGISWLGRTTSITESWLEISHILTETTILIEKTCQLHSPNFFYRSGIRHIFIHSLNYTSDYKII